jgi:secondary thiamine-phosphate synthase enzyme
VVRLKASIAPERHEAADWGSMHTTEIELDTSRERIVDLTMALERFCAGRGDGLVNVFVPHATAGLALMERGSGSEGDLLAALERLLPRDDRYQHAHGSPGHGADHLLPALVNPSATLPVLGGRVAFGTWQSLLLVDLNVDNPRRHVRFSFLPAPS